jgi:sensor histidine kinase regulating citrate/malate metabolism
VELVVSQDSRLDDGVLPASLPARDLVTILGNLIDNAVDAAQGSLRARVTVTAYAEHTELVMRVADTGAGVDPAHAELVFQRGFSTKPAGPGGRGLGLALVSQAVNRHEGTLTVAEAREGGAVFEARLPLVTAAPPETAAPETAAPEAATPEASAPKAATSESAAPSEAAPSESTASGTAPHAALRGDA